jgi:hypothetical protein
LAIFVGNSLVEAAASAILVVAVISVWKQIEKGGKKQGSDL